MSFHYPPCVQILATQTTRLNIFYRFHAPGDNGRLINLCGNLLKAADEVGPTFLNDNARLHLCRKIFRYVDLEDKKNFSRLPVRYGLPSLGCYRIPPYSCLRFLQVFCTDKDYEYLSKHGWYDGVIKLIQASAPVDGFMGVEVGCYHTTQKARPRHPCLSVSTVFASC